jgi:hypothetical protein
MQAEQLMTPDLWVRTVAGADAERLGRLVEGQLQAQHDDYDRQGVARLRKQWPSITINNRRGGVRVIGGAPVDFLGVAEGGRAIALECKSNAPASRGGKPLPSMSMTDSGLAPHQVDVLAGWACMGAIVTVAWFNTDRLGYLSAVQVRDLLVGDRWRLGRTAPIPREAFCWLEPGEWDWLSPWLEGERAVTGGGK